MLIPSIFLAIQFILICVMSYSSALSNVTGGWQFMISLLIVPLIILTSILNIVASIIKFIEIKKTSTRIILVVFMLLSISLMWIPFQAWIADIMEPLFVPVAQFFKWKRKAACPQFAGAAFWFCTEENHPSETRHLEGTGNPTVSLMKYPDPSAFSLQIEQGSEISDVKSSGLSLKTRAPEISLVSSSPGAGRSVWSEGATTRTGMPMAGEWANHKELYPDGKSSASAIKRTRAIFCLLLYKI